MGRGRAKAKQTKVARELKYSSPQTDFTQLQHELSHPPNDRYGSHAVDDDADDGVEEDDWRR
jgi:hypothetical protein